MLRLLYLELLQLFLILILPHQPSVGDIQDILHLFKFAYFLLAFLVGSFILFCELLFDVEFHAKFVHISVKLVKLVPDNALVQSFSVRLSLLGEGHQWLVTHLNRLLRPLDLLLVVPLHEQEVRCGTGSERFHLRQVVRLGDSWTPNLHLAILVSRADYARLGSAPTLHECDVGLIQAAHLAKELMLAHLASHAFCSDV